MSSEDELSNEEVEEEEEEEEEPEEEVVVKKKRKAKGTKKGKDPSKPKRNMSAFFLYSNANRPRVKAENPDASFGELVSNLFLFPNVHVLAGVLILQLRSRYNVILFLLVLLKF